MFSVVWVTRTVWSCMNITMVVLCMLFGNLNMVGFLQETCKRTCQEVLSVFISVIIH